MRLWLLLLAGARAAVNTKKHLDWLTHQRKHALPHRINSRHERWAKAHIELVDAAPPLAPGERLDAEHTIPVHYFFIDRDDPRNPNKVPPMIREMVRNYTQTAAANGLRVNITVAGFDHARSIVSRVHPDLGWLWDRLEVEHATCFSNLYRLAALYVYGGIYHDAKIWLSPPGLAGVVRAFGTYDLVFEERPSGAAEARVRRRVRATNMAAARPGSAFLKQTLLKLRDKMLLVYEKGPELIANRQLIWSVGSQSLLSAIHDGLDNVTKGHTLVGYHCFGDSPKYENCSDAEDIPGQLDGDRFVIRQWGPRLVPEIIGAYNQGGRRHWSKSKLPLFRKEAYGVPASDRPVAPGDAAARMVAWEEKLRKIREERAAQQLAERQAMSRRNRDMSRQEQRTKLKQRLKPGELTPWARAQERKRKRAANTLAAKAGGTSLALLKSVDPGTHKERVIMGTQATGKDV